MVLVPVYDTGVSLTGEKPCNLVMPTVGRDTRIFDTHGGNSEVAESMAKSAVDKKMWQGSLVVVDST